MLLLLPLAYASVLTTLTVTLPGGGEVTLEKDTATLPATGMTSIEDNLGRTWEVLIDVDDLGQNALVVMDVRVYGGGQLLDHIRPQLLVPVDNPEGGAVAAGRNLPIRVEGTAECTATRALHALERSVFYDPRQGAGRIRTWWPNAKVECWDPGVTWSMQDGWLQFDIQKRLGPGQSHFTQCEVDGRDLQLYLYAH